MIWKNRERGVGEESGGAMAFAFGRATPSLRQAPSRCLDNPVPGNIIFSLNGEHHLLLKVLHFRVDKRRETISIENKLSSDSNLLKSGSFDSFNYLRRGFFHVGPGLDVKTRV